MPKWLHVYTIKYQGITSMACPNGCIYTVQLLRLLYHVKSILSAWVHDQLFLRHSLIFNSLITIAYNIIYKGAVVSGTASIHIYYLIYFALIFTASQL